MYTLLIVRPPFRVTAHVGFILAVLLFLPAFVPAAAQNRDFHAERIVLDDNGDDGTANTITITAPNPLGQDVIVTIPDPGTGSVQFLLVPPGTPGTWLLNGNTGTTAGTSFLGTTDDQPFQIHIDNDNVTGNDGRGRVMRFEPNATSANIIGGFQQNSVASGVVGATISGGGYQLSPNRISSNYATIGGGAKNIVGTSSVNSTIAGGVSNAITATAQNGTIAGGLNNQIVSGDHSTISGGFNNSIQSGSFGSTISGGTNNQTSSLTTVIGGGNQNAIGTSAFFSTIAGGTADTIGSNSPRSTISGGSGNTIGSGGVNSTGSVIGGGMDNTIAGRLSAIPGGRGLTLIGDGSFGFLSNSGGSHGMSISSSNVAVFGNADLWLANNDNAAGKLRFYEAYNTSGTFPNSANYTSFQAQTQAADIEYILPAAAGTAGDQLTISAVSGTQVTLGWAVASDRAKKTDFLTLSGESVLRQFRGLDLGTWRYDPSIDPKGTRHYGIMAQDFHAAFGNDGLGEIGTDTAVTNLDLHGVSYLAIQGLEERTERQAGTIRSQAGRIEHLEDEVQMLRDRNEELHEQILELRRMIENRTRE